MPETIAQAYVQILPSAEGIQGSLTKLLGGEVESAGRDLGGAFSKGLGTAGAVAGTLMTGAASLGADLIRQTGDLASFGDSIDKMSQKMGISAQAYQEWDAILQHSGSSINSLLPSMKSLASAVDSGSDAFGRIGISIEDAANMSQEDLFAATIAGLQGVESESERMAIAAKLLGRGATELGPLLNTSAEDIESMRQRVHELGGVMSDEAVKAAAAYQDTLQDMSTSVEGLKRGLVSEFLPDVTTVMGGLTDLFAGDSDKGLGAIGKGVDGIAEKLAENAPKLFETGGRLIEAIGSAVIANAPALLSAAASVLTSLAADLINNLPMFIEVGVQIIFALAGALVDALPELIPATVEMILTLVDKLTDPDTLMQLVDVAFELMGALAVGLIDAIPKLIEKAPQIVGNLVEAILKLGPKLAESGLELLEKLGEGLTQGFEQIGEIVSNWWTGLKESIDRLIRGAVNWGRDLIQNFIDGILEKWEALKQTVSDAAQTVKDFLGFSEPTKGPLSDFHTYAPDMIDLFNEGLRDNEYKLQEQLTASLSFDGLKNGMSRQLLPENTHRGASAAEAGAKVRQQTVILMLDRTELGRVVYELNGEESQRIGLRLEGGVA